MIAGLKKHLSLVAGVCALAGCTHSTTGLKSEQNTPSQQWIEEIRRRQAPLLDELEALDSSNSMVTLYTIDPHSLKTDAEYGKSIPQPSGVQSFHDWKVLGSVVIESEKVRMKLLSDLIRGGREAGEGPANCFFPRHGLRIETKGRTVDILVCFECMGVEVWGLKSNRGYVTSSSPAVYYNELVAKYRLPLAK